MQRGQRAPGADDAFADADGAGLRQRIGRIAGKDPAVIAVAVAAALLQKIPAAEVSSARESTVTA